MLQFTFFCCRTPTWTQSANLPLVLRPRPPRRPRHPASSEAVAHSPPPRQTPPLPLRPRPPHLPLPWSTICSRRKTSTTRRIFPGTLSGQNFHLRCPLPILFSSFSLEARLDRALSEVSSLKVDNHTSSLYQALTSGEGETARSTTASDSTAGATAATSTTSSSAADKADALDAEMVSLATSLASDLADLVQSMNLAALGGDGGREDQSAGSRRDTLTTSSTAPPTTSAGGLDLSLPPPVEKERPKTSAAAEVPAVTVSCQQPPPPPPSSSSHQSTEDKKNSANASMSASDPNLTASEAASSLLETFAAVARRRSGVLGSAAGTGGGVGASSATSSSVASTNSRNQAVSSAAAAAAAAAAGAGPSGAVAPGSRHGGIFGHGTKSVSSLVRLALSSNFPSGLLNAAQSYPTLGPQGQPSGIQEVFQSPQLFLIIISCFCSPCSHHREHFFFLRGRRREAPGPDE